MSRFASVSAAVLAVAIAATTVHAADSVTVVPTIQGVTTSGGSVTPVTDQVGNTLYVYSAGQSATYTVNYAASGSFTAGNQFASVLFGLKPTPSLTLGTYSADNTSGAWLNVPNGASNVLVNGSFGNTPTSLNQIAASVGKGPYTSTTPQAKVGITSGSASSIGNATVVWDGVTGGQVLKFQDATGTVGQLQFASESSSTGTIGATQTGADPLTVQFVTALGGDANFDGKVDIKDLGILAGNYQGTLAGGAAVGDFNNDGKVDIKDLGILAGNYQSNWTQSLPSPLVELADLPAFGAAPAPEPASLGVLALGGMALLARRRKA